MDRRWWLLPLLSAGLALGLWAVVYLFGWLPDYIVFVRFSLGYLVIGMAGGVAILSGLFLLALTRQAKRSAELLTADRNEAARRRRQFLLRLDHELKNPVTTMQMESASLAEWLGETVPPEQQAALARLRNQTARLHDLAVQLRKLAELETITLSLEPVALDELLGALLDDLRDMPGGSERQTRLRLSEVPWRLPPVQADPDLIYLALHNLLSNALKFTAPGGTIEVRAFETGRAATIEIADNGQGIPEDEITQVWEELFRGQAARSLPGSGIGLAMVRTIIERHGGSIDLRSRVGQGTVVAVSLPME